MPSTNRSRRETGCTARSARRSSRVQHCSHHFAGIPISGNATRGHSRPAQVSCVEYSHLFFEAMMERLVGMLELPTAVRRSIAIAGRSAEEERRSRRRWWAWSGLRCWSPQRLWQFSPRAMGRRNPTMRRSQCRGRAAPGFQASRAQLRPRGDNLFERRSRRQCDPPARSDRWNRLLLHGEIKRMNSSALFTESHVQSRRG